MILISPARHHRHDSDPFAQVISDPCGLSEEGLDLFEVAL